MLRMMFLPLTLLAVFPSVLSAPVLGQAPPIQKRDIDTPIAAFATGWYPSWVANEFPLEKISWSKYNALTFAFGCAI